MQKFSTYLIEQASKYYEIVKHWFALSLRLWCLNWGDWIKKSLAGVKNCVCVTIETKKRLYHSRTMSERTLTKKNLNSYVTFTDTISSR